MDVDLTIRADSAKLAELSKKVASIAKKIPGEVAEALKIELEHESPHKTGKLAEGWTVEEEAGHFAVQNDVSYAQMVIDGTRPHEISPRNAHILSFQVKGTMVFAHKVHHPGTKPNHFVDKAIDTTLAGLELLVNKGLMEAGVLE